MGCRLGYATLLWLALFPVVVHALALIEVCFFAFLFLGVPILCVLPGLCIGLIVYFAVSLANQPTTFVQVTGSQTPPTPSPAACPPTKQPHASQPYAARPAPASSAAPSTMAV
ncbi:unnamed protein product, partial [Mesorhabditis spiculigera]